MISLTILPPFPPAVPGSLWTGWPGGLGLGAVVGVSCDALVLPLVLLSVLNPSVWSRAAACSAGYLGAGGVILEVAVMVVSCCAPAVG